MNLLRQFRRVNRFSGTLLTHLNLAFAMATICLDRGADKNTHDSYYLGVLYGNGNILSIQLRNRDKKEGNVDLERYSANGSLLETVARAMPGGATARVRLDLSQPGPEMGWVRMLCNRRSISASATDETIIGNTLLTSPRGRPASRGPTGRIPRLNHRWMLDLANSDNAALEYFVNLSKHPVQLGVCMSDHARFFCGTLNHTVGPMAGIAFRLNIRIATSSWNLPRVTPPQQQFVL